MPRLHRRRAHGAAGHRQRPHNTPGASTTSPRRRSCIVTESMMPRVHRRRHHRAPPASRPTAAYTTIRCAIWRCTPWFVISSPSPTAHSPRNQAVERVAPKEETTPSSSLTFAFVLAATHHRSWVLAHQAPPTSYPVPTATPPRPPPPLVPASATHCPSSRLTATPYYLRFRHGAPLPNHCYPTILSTLPPASTMERGTRAARPALLGYDEDEDQPLLRGYNEGEPEMDPPLFQYDDEGRHRRHRRFDPTRRMPSRNSRPSSEAPRAAADTLACALQRLCPPR
ncbi:hypothetical protein BDZ97DRAFT_1918532 [Flammula alnicola]|nr:hypothetical protein BDZ97DRAFT_1918532 [Flammula alnicola]